VAAASNQLCWCLGRMSNSSTPFQSSIRIAEEEPSMASSNSIKELAGKVALVTGGARNIGAATSLALAEAGAAVAINTRASREDGDAIVKQIRDGGGHAE